MLAPPQQPVWDTLHGEWVIPYSCPCCVKCWLIVKGRKTGQCVSGGHINIEKGRTSPYMGYIEIRESD